MGKKYKEIEFETLGVDNSSKININDNPDNKEDESLVVTGDDLEKDLTLIT